MNFNVVIGNPPYNRGGDIDFVNLSYKIQTDFVVMITPAKWQTADDSKGNYKSKMTYSQFRKKLVPHMREVVYYPNSLDVFEKVYQIDGISYFIIEKSNTFGTVKITNRCKSNSLLNQTVERQIRDNSLLNIYADIGSFVQQQYGYATFKISQVKCCCKGRYQLWCNTQMPGNQLVQGDGRALGIGLMTIIDTAKEKIGRDSDIEMIYAQDNVHSVVYVKQFLRSKFTRFWLVQNVQKLNNILVDHYFRFVPSPMVLDEQGNRVTGKFDHIYTDEELYKTWNLPQKYIDVIEAVIKERK